MNSVSLVQRAHQSVAEVLAAGDIAVDATVGNGHDTLFLARAVGEGGRVYGFDIQQQALDEARHRLDQAGIAERVALYHAGHEVMALLLPDDLRGRVKAVMFNLGYLPRGDKSRTTRPATTLSALSDALGLLAPGGRISVLAYTGHSGGREETEAIKAWAATLPRDLFTVTVEIPATDRGNAPEWLLIEKLHAIKYGVSGF